MKRARVLIADDHTLVAAGMRKLLERDFDVVGTVEDGRALLAEAQRLGPDVILVDISMPRLNGIDAARQLRTLAPSSKVVFVSMHADPTYADEAFKAGAVGYLAKRSAPAELSQAIRSVLRGERYMTGTLPREGPPEPAPRGKRPAGSLTDRQREVLQLVAEGRTAREIATALRISLRTVEFHKAQIEARLGLHGVAELTRYAVLHGLVDPA